MFFTNNEEQCLSSYLTDYAFMVSTFDSFLKATLNGPLCLSHKPTSQGCYVKQPG